ncbi:MAG: hypothetical protein AB7R89_04400 [Dehalococcoidia bacterium]
MVSRTISNQTTVAPTTREAAHGAVATAASNRWALWGVPAAVLGFAGLMVTPDYAGLETTGAGVIEQLDRGGYHLGIVLGIAAALCMLITAAGWQRWGARVAPDSLAARLVPMAFAASAALMMLGYGFMGSLAVYLPGGMDDGTFPTEGLYSVFMFLDFAPYIAWWGAAFAAIGIAWLSLRERSLPIWIGVVSALFALIPIAFMSITGLPGFPGVVDPLWLLIVSAGMALRRNTGARPAIDD